MTLRTAGIGALLVSLGFGMASNLMFFAAFQFRADSFLDPTRIILDAGPTSAELMGWAAALDLVGYYLATSVLAYVLWRQLRPRNALIADLSALCAFGYTVAGGAAAAVISIVGPMLVHDYTNATSADKAPIAAQLKTLFEVVERAIWQFFDAILLGAWFLGIGILIKPDRPGLARLSVLLGAAGVVTALVNLAGLNLALAVMLAVLFPLWTVWLIWLLVLFTRSHLPRPLDRPPEHAVA